MSAAAPQTQRAGSRLLTRISFIAGAAGLLATMALDSAAVIGRLIGWPLLGSIELIRAAVVIAASSALVGVTLDRSHASIHLLTERVSPQLRSGLSVLSRLLCAGFFAWLAAGSLWISAELWDSAEASELLELPYAPLRLFWCASALLIVVLFVTSAFDRSHD